MERHLTDEELIKLDKNYKEPKYIGPERRRAINSFVEEYHERRRAKKSKK
jgi:hypothetical protein